VYLEAASTGQNYALSTLDSATVDTVSLSTLATGSKILLKDQFEYLENGIYIKSNSGSGYCKIQVLYFHIKL